MNKVFKIVGLSFAGVGLIMLSVAVLKYMHTRAFVETAEEATGTVIELTLRRSRTSDGYNSRTYYPVVEFTGTDGEVVEFVGAVGSSPPAFSVGEEVAVCYDPAQPNKACIKSFFQLWFLSVLFGVMGAVFGTLGIIFLHFQHRRKVQNQWVENFGRSIIAEIQSADINRMVRVNGRHPYHILAQWQDPTTSKVYMFKSPDIWYNPEKYIEGKEISVKINPNDPRQYMVDITFLPEQG